MNDKAKSTLTTAYLMFTFEFADPSTVNVEALKDKVGPLDVFQSQRSADKAKQVLGKKDFAKLLSLYFAKFQTSDGFDYTRLEQELMTHKQIFERHLGRDRMRFLNLLISTMKSLESDKPKRGLLGVA